MKKITRTLNVIEVRAKIYYPVDDSISTDTFPVVSGSIEFADSELSRIIEAEYKVKVLLILEKQVFERVYSLSVYDFIIFGNMEKSEQINLIN